MTNSIEQEMYAAIGRALSCCQFFEFMFTLCVKLVFKQRAANTIDEIAPLDHNSFRPAITTLLRELKDVIEVDSSFETEINDFAERRHTLIHRWFVQNGWPTPNNQHEQSQLTHFSLALAQDAVKLTTLLAKYVIEWMKRFPETMERGLRLEQDWEILFAAVGFAIKIERTEPSG